MPIDPSVAIGAELGSHPFSWTESDVLLYQLAIGATDLSYTLEGPALQVLPSFGVVAPTFHETDPPPLDLPGCDINLAQVVHGSQSISVAGPIPTTGSATVTTRISEIWDKGKAAVIWQEGVAVSPTGEELWTTRSSIFVKGEGGWGGDRNPLHADPDFAKAAGFPAPILHGLCSYGIVLRTLTDELLGGDATRVAGFGVKFAGVLFPGETIRVRGWRDEDRIVATATVAGGERDGAPVLGDVVLTVA